jgi:rhomboid family protein
MIPLRDENPKPVGYKPFVTYALIAINVIVFFWEISVTGQFYEFTNRQAEEIFLNYGTVPSAVTTGLIDRNYGAVTSIFSSMFLHAGLIHIGGNMLFLYIFGDNIEYRFGRGKYLALYLFWGLVAGFAQILSDPSSPVPSFGASGAISGVLGAYVVIFPNAKVLTLLFFGFFIRTIRLSVKWYIPFWIIFQILLPAIGVSTGGVAYFAHLGGFLIGMLTGFLYKKTNRSEFMYGTRYGWKDK